MKIIGDIQVIRSDSGDGWTWAIDVGPESKRGPFRQEAVVVSFWTYQTAARAMAAARRWFEQLGLTERGA